jgi:hypothetical protein
MKAIASLVPAFFGHVALRRVLGGIVFAIGVLVIAGESKAANTCGITWTLPATPFEEHGLNQSFRFQYWRKLGSLKLPGIRSSEQDGKEAFELSVHIGFKPASSYSSLLGYGFEFALFDSRLVWMGGEAVQLHLPDGNEIHLKYDKIKRTLSAHGWLGKCDPKAGQAIIKASCGWVLHFAGNRLHRMTSPEGETLTFSTLSNGTRQLNQAGRTIVTLTPDWDKRTTQKFYQLKFGNKRALLKMGVRPIVIQEKGKPERVVMAPALSEIRMEDKAEERLSFKRNELKISGSTYLWDAKTYRLLQAEDKKYSYPIVKGVRCLKTEYVNGHVTILGSDASQKFKVSQNGKNAPLYYSEFFMGGPVANKLRRHYMIDEQTGRETLLRQEWYDENGKSFRSLVREGENERIYHRSGREYIVQDKKTQKILKKYIFDDRNRLITYLVGEREYCIDHSSATVVEVVAREGKNIVETLSLPVESYQRMIKQFFPTQVQHPTHGGK